MRNHIMTNERDEFAVQSDVANVNSGLPRRIELFAVTTQRGNIRLGVEDFGAGGRPLAITLDREHALALASWIQSNV